MRIPILALQSGEFHSIQRFAKMPDKAGPRESVKKFLADLRTNYQARKKNKLPMEKKRRQLSIGYFILAFSRS